MVLTTPIKEGAHADDGYQPRPWISTVLLSHPGLALGTQTLQRSFPTLEALANPTLDSSRSAKTRVSPQTPGINHNPTNGVIRPLRFLTRSADTLLGDLSIICSDYKSTFA